MTHVLRLNDESWRLLVTITTETGSHPLGSVSIAPPEDIFLAGPNLGTEPACREAHQLRRRPAFAAGEDRRPPVPSGYGEATGARGERGPLQAWGTRAS